MPVKPHPKACPNVTITDGDREIHLAYECWKTQDADGIVSARGKTDADQKFLAENRADVANMIKHEEGLREIRYFENQGNGLHTPIQLETNPQGWAVSAQAVHGASLKTPELHEQGQRMIDAAHSRTTNLASQEFSEALQKIRDDLPPSPE